MAKKCMCAISILKANDLKKFMKIHNK